MVKIIILVFYILLFTLGLNAQNRPTANNDTTYSNSVNVLLNDSDLDNDALRILDYQINGVKYSTRNSSRQTDYGQITFNSSGDVICDSICSFMYRISDGNRGVDTAYVTFLKPLEVIGDTNKMVLTNTIWVSWTKKVNCINNPNGSIKVEVQNNDGTMLLNGVLKPNDWIYCIEGAKQYSFIINHELALKIENEGCKE